MSSVDFIWRILGVAESCRTNKAIKPKLIIVNTNNNKSIVLAINIIRVIWTKELFILKLRLAWYELFYSPLPESLRVTRSWFSRVLFAARVTRLISSRVTRSDFDKVSKLLCAYTHGESSGTRKDWPAEPKSIVFRAAISVSVNSQQYTYKLICK